MTTSVLALVAAAAALSGPHTLPLLGAPSAAAEQASARHAETLRVADRAADVAAMLAALNARRTAHGLPVLRLDPALCGVAYEHAADMAEHDYFDHTSLDGSSPFQRMDRAHVAYGYAGENLALDQNGSAAELALWHSSEHRENILGSHYAKVGIAAVTGSDGEIFVEDFSD